MRKVLLLTILLVSAFIAQAQYNDAGERSTAASLINANKTQLGLSSDQASNLIIQTSYVIQGTDFRMAYAQQSYKGIPVHNRILVLAFKDGKVVSRAGDLLTSMEGRTNNLSGLASVSVQDALRTALADRKALVNNIPAATQSVTSGKLEFGKMGVATENITAELLWLPGENDKTVKLVWQFFIAPKNSSDYWLVRVDANTNQVAGVENLTIYCNWDNTGHSIEEHFNENHFDKSNTGGKINNFVLRRDEKTNRWQYRPFVENSGAYRVVRYPAESPLHPGGTPQIHTNPWTWAPGNATTLKWHSDGTTDFNDTRGNNVLAAEDQDGNNTPGLLAVSSTALPDLNFDFTPNFTVVPTQTTPVPNQQFNITNLFYWNNMIHDITYVYGFDEVSGNFQVNNLGRGGLGNDRVNADAQNPGNCNANFGTPADGISPRMQMFLCTNVSPARDGDADNAVILHEYGHGISNRLTGGPANVSCLNNAEQMGEGWSDYYGLMLTQDWATATPADGFNNPRGIGTYLFGQAPNGPGIRPTRYSTNFAINPTTYANLPPPTAIPHGVGYVWCTMLWEMTWEIIQTQGINTNLFNPAGGGGNAIALKLVQEGMRLQPCSPGFVQGRDAILRADTLFFGAQNSCAIIRAFARRGLGVNASQGSSASTSDGVPDFSVDATVMTLTANVPAQIEGGNIIYTTSVTAGNCTPIANYTITDTLPTNVTYVSGGSYNAGNRVVSFNPVNIPTGATQTFVFTVQVNPGSWFPPLNVLSENVDGVVAPALPAGWASTSTTAGNNWVSSTTQRRSLPNSFFTPNVGITSDQILTSPVFSIPAAPPPLVFWHSFSTEASFDGGVVEISLNGGTTWADIGAGNFISGGYTSVLNAGAPIGGRPAFNGNSGGFIQSRVNLTPYASQANVRIRFRFGSDASVPGTGWFVDDISCSLLPVVNMRSNLFNASNVRVKFADVVTDILPGACVDPAITTHPASVVRCSVPGNAVFTVAASGTAPSYQWQVSSNNGSTWTNIGGATSTSFTITNPTSALNSNSYRCVVTGLCGVPVNSNPATLHVSPVLTHTATSATPATTCAPGATVITGTANNGTAGTNGLIGSSGVINLAVPDNNPAGVNTSINVGTVAIPAAGNLKLRINVNSHTWTGDAIFRLTSPCGTTFLFDRPGVPASTFGNSDDLNGVYIFDLAGATVIPEASVGGAIPAGTYQPSDVNGAAHTWAGFTFPCTAAGIWTLNVSDNAGGDTGALIDWGILVGGNYTHTLTGAGTIVQNPPTGANNSIANFSVTAIPGGNQAYTITSTDVLGCTVVSTINVTVTTAPTVTSQPANRVICAGQNTTFALVDNSPLPPTYQWQVSINGGTSWTNLANVVPFSNVTTPTLTVTGAGTVYNGNLFRCVLISACGTSTSNNATLTVNPLPVVNSGPSGFCAPQTLTASGNSNTYSWSPATGLNTTTGATVIANPTVTTVYTVTGTLTATGCQNFASVTVLGTPLTPVITPAAPVVCGGVVQPLSVPATTATYTATGTIAIPGSGTGTATGEPANPYPSLLSITGLPTTGVRVKSVTINGVTHTFPDDIDIVLQSPAGTSVVLMSDIGGGADNTGQNFTFDDAAAGLMSFTALNPSGTYRPSNDGATDNWPAPGPGSLTQATPTLSSFTGNANGNWSLFIVDDLGGDIGSISSWSITFEIATAVWTPITGLYSNAAGTIPYVAGTPASTVYFLQSPAAVTSYTYSVTNVLGTCSSGAASVTVTVNPAPTIAVSPNNQCGPVVLNATGNSNTYAWSPAAGLSVTTGATVTANPTLNTLYTVTGTLTATGCTASATATVNATPAAPVIIPSSVNMCVGSITQFNAQATAITTPLGGTITIPAGAPGNTAAGIASPYPTAITLGGLPATGVRIKSVNINGISHTFPGDIDILLQSPTSQNVILMSDAGGGTDIVNANLVFDDAAAGVLPATIVSGTYRPTNTAGPDDFPAPGPGSITNVNPALSSFTGNLNGTWNLYVVDDAGGDVGSITSWSITFEIVGAIWSPVTGLFTDPVATVPYVANTMVTTVYAKPATTTSYSVTRATATCTSAATTVPVNVYQPLTITTQPANQTVCQGATATFSVVLGGTFPSYQWQVSTDGGTNWNNIAGANNSSLVLTGTTTALSGNRYRVQATNSCTSVTSTSATLTVNPLPTVTTTALPSKICISDTLLALSGLPVGGSWSGIGVSGLNFVPPATAVGTYTLTYTYASPAGCVASSTVVAKVEDCPERIRLLRDNAVILWPNPNNGRFNIRINSVLYNYLNMKVYTSTGQLVRTQNFGGLVYGRIIPIDITNLPADIYIVRFYYDDGVRTSEKAFKVVVGGH